MAKKKADMLVMHVKVVRNTLNIGWRMVNPDDLAQLQSLVGGMLERVQSPDPRFSKFELWCNEEGTPLNLPFSTSTFYPPTIRGNYFITRRNLRGLTQADYQYLLLRAV